MLKSISDIQQFMLGMIVLCEKVRWEYDEKDDECAYKMSPSVHGFVMPFKKTLKEGSYIVAHPIATHDTWVES